MIGFLILLALLVALVMAVFLLGFRLGGQGWLAELQRSRAEAAQAERQLHDLTRQAFISMTDTAEQRRRQQ